MIHDFLVIFFHFLTGYYIMPVSLYYLLTFFKDKEKMKKRKIQVASRPSRQTVKREIAWSVCSILIFSICATALYQFIKSGRTNVYFNIRERGWVYFLISPLLCIIIHDTYYYWLHRMMHHKRFFRYFHRVHHLSVTPTPWAIYSFQPLEAFMTFLSFAGLILFLPLHPVAFGVYMLISLINNIGGHTGYEVMPSWVATHPVMKYTTVVTFHDMHHTNTKYNYGAYFNIWDRIMHTVHKDYEQKFMLIAGADTKSGSDENQPH